MEMETGRIIYIQRKRQEKIPSLYFDGLNILNSQLKEKKKSTTLYPGNLHR